jgi:hypothetical protein
MTNLKDGADAIKAMLARQRNRLNACEGLSRDFHFTGQPGCEQETTATAQHA